MSDDELSGRVARLERQISALTSLIYGLVTLVGVSWARQTYDDFWTMEPLAWLISSAIFWLIIIGGAVWLYHHLNGD